MTDWIKAFALEQKVAGIIHRQEKAGFQFDKEKAIELIEDLAKKKENLYKVIRPTLSMEMQRVSKVEVKAPFLKSGEYRQAVLTHYPENIPDIGGPFSRIEWEEPSLSKRNRISSQLLRLGWKPEWFTEKGGPQMTRKGEPAPSLGYMEGEIGKSLSLWFTYAHRMSQIKGWVYGSKAKGYISPIRADGRIPAKANSLGTPTARMRHSIIVNVPKAKKKVIYGEEMRSLFIAKEGYVLAGHDASALEGRMEAHYTYPFDNGEYAKEILEGDIHTKNAKIFGVTRDLAKNGKYCLPLDTQILTYNGWKTYQDISVGDLVMGFNTHTGIKEWCVVEETMIVPNQDVYTIKGKGFSYRATGNHRWAVRQRTELLKRNKTKIEDYPVTFRTTLELNTESNLIVNAPMKIYEGNNYEQGKCKYGVDWTKKVISMSSSERAAFLDGFLIADGHFDRKKGSWCWYQNRNEHAEAALTASYMIHDGVIATNGSDHIAARFSKKSHRTCQRVSIKKTSTEDTFCLTTSLGTFVMRQGDDITITGNCLTYGGQYAKLASTLGVSKGKGKQLFDDFWRGNYALNQLREKLERFYDKNGWIPGIDGRKIYVRSKHALVNTLFQSAGAIVMKISMCYLDDWVKREGLDVTKVGDFHDEAQAEVHPKDVERYKELAVKSVIKAGEYLKLRCPLDAEAKEGLNWAETH